jgi:hypothetical protein
MKTKTEIPDYEGQLLEEGFSTECKFNGERSLFRACRGEIVTGWHTSWLCVLREVCGQKDNEPK